MITLQLHDAALRREGCMHPPGFLPFLRRCSLSLRFAFAVFVRHLHSMSITGGAIWRQLHPPPCGCGYDYTTHMWLVMLNWVFVDHMPNFSLFDHLINSTTKITSYGWLIALNWLLGHHMPHVSWLCCRMVSCPSRWAVVEVNEISAKEQLHTINKNHILIYFHQYRQFLNYLPPAVANLFSILLMQYVWISEASLINQTNWYNQLL